MKKLLVLLFAVVLTVALVACGTDTTTTSNPGTTAAPTANPGTTATTTTGANTGNTTTPTTSSTEAPSTTEPPVTTAPRHSGVDILNGEYENMAVNGVWNGINACAFEDHHAVLDFRVALVIQMLETDNGIYETLIFTDETDTNNQTNGIMNDEYKWVVIIDGVEMEITNFSLLNDQTHGYVRMDLGDWTYSTDLDEEGYHEYDIELLIYEKASNQIAYWAYLTDPEMNGLYYYKQPDPIVMKDDPNRDPSHVVISADKVEPLSGPEGFSNETYNLLFDNDVRSKLCTNNTTDATVIKFTSEQHIVSYSLVNANDDESYSDRTPLQWTLYGSADGNQWEVIDTQNLTETDHTNYQERNFVLANAGDYSYIKFEPVVSGMYQISDILFYTTEDYANQ